jgi:drug/metabolite transporter (DMT)-like permease
MHLLAALCASVLLSAGILLQARDAREAPATLSLRAGLIWFLLHRWRFCVGTLATMVSALLQILALRQLSVAVVQSISAAGILLLPLHAAYVQRRAPPLAELGASVAIVAGVTLGSITIPAQAEALRAGTLPLFGGAGALSILALLAARRLRSAWAMSIVAGVGLGAAALLQKVLALSSPGVAQLGGAIALLVGCGAIGFLAQMSALQVAPAVRVAPAVLAISTALPIFAAPLLFGEVWPHGALTACSLLAALCIAAWLSKQVHGKHPELGGAAVPQP